MPLSDVVFSSESGDWGTPPALYNRLNEKYEFTYDPASSTENHLTAAYSTFDGTYYLLDKVNDADGLTAEWYGRIFLNPPYGRGIAAWMEKAAKAPGLVVALLPVRTGSRWWQQWVAPYADIEFLAGRLKFVGAENSAPFDSAIVRYR